MSHDNQQTNGTPGEFDYSQFPPNALIHERRTGHDRRSTPPQNKQRVKGKAGDGQPEQAFGERRVRKERRRRVDPTTFEKQYTPDELEFMNAMQYYKDQTRRQFPTYGEVLKVAVSLGYRKGIEDHTEA